MAIPHPPPISFTYTTIPQNSTIIPQNSNTISSSKFNIHTSIKPQNKNFHIKLSHLPPFLNQKISKIRKGCWRKRIERGIGYTSEIVKTLYLGLICYTTNNLRNKIPVVLSEFFGFLNDNLKGHCRHSPSFFTLVIIYLFPLLIEGRKLPDKTPIWISMAGTKLKGHKDRHPFG